MRYKNRSKQIFRFLTTGIVFLVLLCTLNPRNAMANELFFDEDGNLYFHTRDKKALGNVRFKTLGWVIKRYDMPMDAPGQQYVIVQKQSYRTNEPDPDDDMYVLSYFKSDRDEILNAVKSVSEDWYRILTGYGDDVYIDSVMTVCEGDEDQGVLYKNGTYEGEIYLTYEGISNARGWTNITVNILKNHYNMVLQFPQQVKRWEPYVEIIDSQYIDITTSRYAAFQIGAGTYGEEKYDVINGIPSGEQLYLKGLADSSRAVLCVKKVKARLTECVEVPVTYRMQWVDYYGVRREDTRLIYRYYPVTREFTYYQYVSFDEYWLSSVSFSGSILDETRFVNVDISGNDRADIEVVSYGSLENHIVSYEKSNLSSIGTVQLTGSGGKKPAIPNTDYSGLADEQVSDVKVRSDKIIIEQQLVLSDEICVKNGSGPTTLFKPKSIDIYSEDINICKTVDNGLYEDCTVTLTYKNKYNIPAVFKHSCGDVFVHTPVLCQSETYVKKELNQAVEPTDKDVVLGEEFTIAFNDFGRHRSIKGYGLASYTKYVGARQVCCPFAVMYNGKYYQANQWIDIQDYNVKLIACEENTEGKYTVYTRTIAYNGLNKTDAKYMEEMSNIYVGHYGAWSSIEVRLIGKLHKLQVEYEDGTHNTSELPLEITPDNEKVYDIHFELVGDVVDEDSVQIGYTYFHEDRDGILTPVDVYGVTDGKHLKELAAGKFTEEQSLTPDSCEQNGNVSKWQTSIQLFNKLIVVPKDTTMESIQQAMKANRLSELMYDAGSVIVCVDIVSYKEDAAHLSYINEENAAKGYCNMWLKEGGTNQYPYGAVVKLLLKDYIYYEYEVSGTH